MSRPRHAGAVAYSEAMRGTEVPAFQNPSMRSAPRWADPVATVILSVALLTASGVAALWLGLAVMGTDICAYRDCPHEYRAAWDMHAGHVGVVASLLTGMVGAAAAAARKKRMWWWPLLGILGVVASCCVGIAVMTTAVP